jgi:hypothetical protein
MSLCGSTYSKAANAGQACRSAPACSREHPSGRCREWPSGRCCGLARWLARASRALLCMDGQAHGRSTRKCARQACGPLPHVVRVGSEHVSGLSGTACKHARRCACGCRVPGRAFCVSDLVSYYQPYCTRQTAAARQLIARVQKGARKQKHTLQSAQAEPSTCLHVISIHVFSRAVGLNQYLAHSADRIASALTPSFTSQSHARAHRRRRVRRVFPARSSLLSPACHQARARPTPRVRAKAHSAPLAFMHLRTSHIAVRTRSTPPITFSCFPPPCPAPKFVSTSRHTHTPNAVTSTAVSCGRGCVKLTLVDIELK